MKDRDENNAFNEGSANFGLPEGYFQRSAQDLFRKLEWQEEHKAFPKLLELKEKNVFAVPADYFVRGGQRLEAIQYPTLNSLAKVLPFQVPDHYFEEKENALSEDLSGNELLALPRLGSLEKKNSFVTPKDYFTRREKKLLRTLNKGTAGIIPLFPKRIAFAAAALLLIALGTWLYTFYFVSVPAQDCGTIACVDKKDLIKTSTLERLEDEELYELVDPAQLQKRLDAASASSSGKQAAPKKDSLEDEAEELMEGI